MTLLYGALVAGACVFTYGLDPRADRAALEAAASKAGVSKDVIEALEEAHRKVRGIEDAAQGCTRVSSRPAWTGSASGPDHPGPARAGPKILTRARRFLVTYLDGTRDVVAKYAAQQRDLDETVLAENFRRVLTTIEQVFAEQEEVLKQDDKLDLEVQIEVLETQLKREGVHCRLAERHSEGADAMAENPTTTATSVAVPPLATEPLSNQLRFGPGARRRPADRSDRPGRAAGPAGDARARRHRHQLDHLLRQQGAAA